MGTVESWPEPLIDQLGEELLALGAQVKAIHLCDWKVMRFHRAKSKVLYLGLCNLCCQYNLRNERIEQSPQKRTWEYWWMVICT